METASPVAAPTDTAITIEGVSKSFLLPHERYSSLRERLAQPLQRSTYESFHALREVTVDVRRGETFGVVGRNGSGKSTLLRCVAGIYPVDSGRIAVEGRLASFIELGIGFHPELAARDNAILSAVMFGLSAREAASRFEEMIAFAELEQFVDLKLKNYSTGMAVRLAFAVAIHVDADVLLFDEVLTVGDASFQSKCFSRFEDLKSEGKTIVVVTHNMQLARDVCDRALLLSRGEVVTVGDPDAVAGEYEALNDRRDPLPHAVTEPPQASPRRTRSPLLGPSPQRFPTLVRALAVADFKLKYSNAALSYLWAIARPLALFAVLLLIFTGLGRFDAGVTHYPIYLLTGVMLWTFFIQATSASVESLVHRAAVLRAVPLPHLAVPLSLLLAAVFDLCINLVLVFALIFATGIAPSLSWLELPLLLALLGVLTTGLSLLLAALYVRYRDVDQVWLVLSQSIFYLTPIFYVVASVPAPFDRVMVLANPLAAILTEARHILLDPAAPTAASAAGGGPFLLIPVAICLGMLATGLWIFRRVSPRAAEAA